MPHHTHTCATCGRPFPCDVLHCQGKWHCIFHLNGQGARYVG